MSVFLKKTNAMLDSKLLDVDATTLENIKLMSTQQLMFIGNVANGKTTLANALTGIDTIRYQSELINRGATKYAGYGDAYIYASVDNNILSTFILNNFDANHENKLVGHFSITDTPGHSDLKKTKETCLTSIPSNSIIIMVINANEPLNITDNLLLLMQSNINNVLFMLNKIDLLKCKLKIQQLIDELRELLKGSLYENSPIVPCSATQKWNIDVIKEWIIYMYLHNSHNTDDSSPFAMSVIRTFSIKKNEIRVPAVAGVVLSGSIKVGDDVYIVGPNIKLHNNPIKVNIKGIHCGKQSITKACLNSTISLEINSISHELTQNNGLINTLVVSKLNMINELNDMYLYLFNKKLVSDPKSLSIKKGNVIYINYVGQIIKCTVKEKTKTHISLSLENNMCLLHNNSSMTLVNNNIVIGFCSSSPINNNKSTVNDRFNSNISNIDLLDLSFDCVADRMKLPALKLNMDKYVTYFLNYGTMCKAIGCHPDDLCKWFDTEMTDQLARHCYHPIKSKLEKTELNKDVLCICGNKKQINDTILQKYIKKFAEEYHKCTSCNSYKMTPYIRLGVKYLKCDVCGASSQQKSVSSASGKSHINIKKIERKNKKIKRRIEREHFYETIVNGESESEEESEDEDLNPLGILYPNDSNTKYKMDHIIETNCTNVFTKIEIVLDSLNLFYKRKAKWYIYEIYQKDKYNFKIYLLKNKKKIKVGIYIVKHMNNINDIINLISKNVNQNKDEQNLQLN